MKTLLKSIAIITIAIAVSINSASAKGKKSPPPKQKPKSDPVESYFKAHDKNKDGSIDKAEFSGSDFAKWDINTDGKLSHSEVSTMLGKK